MRTLKLFATAMLLVASLGLAACTGTDTITGSAGDIGGGDKNPPPGAEQPPSKEGPGDVGGDKGGPSDVGGDKGGDADAGGAGNVAGDKQLSEKQLRTYLESLPPSQRVDFYYIEKDCNGCTDTASFKDYLERFCAAEPASCDQEFVALLTKERTTTQIRNDQGLVGLPTAEKLLQAVKQFESGDASGAPAGGDAGGDAAGGDKAGGGDAGSGGDAGTAPGGGDAGTEPGGGDTGAAPGGGDAGSEPGGGDVGGDKSLPLPDAPVASLQAIMGVIEVMKLPEIDWSMVGQAAVGMDLGAEFEEVGSHLAVVAGSGIPIPNCDSCDATIASLLAGDSVATDAVSGLFAALAGK